MQKHPALVYFLALCAVIFWGLSYIWMKVVFNYYGPITTMFLRLSIASVLMLFIWPFLGKKEIIRKEDHWQFLMLSLFSPFFYFLGESFGLRLVSPTLAAVIIATIPVFTPFLGFFVFREKITALNIMGFIVSFSGVIIMILDADFRFSASPTGVLLLFFAVFSALINIVYLKKLALRYSSLTIIRTQNLLGAILFLPLFLILDFRDFISIQPTKELVVSLLLLAIFASTLAFMFYTIAVRSMGVARTSVFSNLIPAFTAIFAFLILKETIDFNKVIGILVVISGIFLSQSSKWAKKRSKKIIE